MTVSEINTTFNSKYFADTVRKGTSAVVAILYVKNDIKVLKILQSTFWHICHMLKLPCIWLLWVYISSTVA